MGMTNWHFDVFCEVLWRHGQEHVISFLSNEGVSTSTSVTSCKKELSGKKYCIALVRDYYFYSERRAFFLYQFLTFLKEMRQAFACTNL